MSCTLAVDRNWLSDVRIPDARLISTNMSTAGVLKTIQPRPITKTLHLPAASACRRRRRRCNNNQFIIVPSCGINSSMRPPARTHWGTHVPLVYAWRIFRAPSAKMQAILMCSGVRWRRTHRTWPIRIRGVFELKIMHRESGPWREMGANCAALGLASGCECWSCSRLLHWNVTRDAYQPLNCNRNGCVTERFCSIYLYRL